MKHMGARRRQEWNTTVKKNYVYRSVGALLALGLGVSACSDDPGFDVSLTEWSVDAPATADAGTVTITAKNEGGETHELVIVRADSTDGFVVDETGKVDEAGFAEDDFIGEIEEFDAGTEESGEFELDAGTYILFCNIVEEEADGSFESHFNEGMQTIIEIS